MDRTEKIMATVGLSCVAAAFAILMLADYSALTAISAIALIITGIVLTWLIKPASEPASKPEDRRND